MHTMRIHHQRCQVHRKQSNTCLPSHHHIPTSALNSLRPLRPLVVNFQSASLSRSETRRISIWSFRNTPTAYRPPQNHTTTNGFNKTHFQPSRVYIELPSDEGVAGFVHTCYHAGGLWSLGFSSWNWISLPQRWLHVVVLARSDLLTE